MLTDHPTVVYFQSGGVLENKMDVVKKPNLIHENFTLLLNKASPRYCFVITLLFFKNLFKNLKMTMLGNDSLIELGKYVHRLELIL